MASQILNDQAFGPAAFQQATGGRESAGTMTYGGVALRALFFLVLTAISAGFGWQAAANKQPSSGMWFFLGYILLISLSLAAARNPRMAAVAGIFYALFMGFWMGSISHLYETYYDGIVGQALMASVATFLAALALYASRAVRVTRRFVQVVMVAMVGLLFTYMIGWLMSLFGADLLFWTQPNTVGIAISVGICLLAAANLVIDFSVIEAGVESGAPAVMAWFGAFGLLTTLAWLYLELLRLLALLRSA